MNKMNARYNMVHQQIQPWGVSHTKILELLFTLPRERFVPEKFQDLAFSDTSIPIACDQVMLNPKVVGRLLQALDLNKKMKVLEIGTGTGYVTALLSRLVKQVISIEIFPELLEEAKETLFSIGAHNVQLEVGDAVNGFIHLAPYDAIIYTGSLPLLPQELSMQIAENGKIFAFLGVEPVMTAVLLKRQGKNHWHKQSLFEVFVPSLINATVPKGFIF